MAGLFHPIRLNGEHQSSVATRGALSMVGVLVQGASRFLTTTLIGRLGGPAVLGAVASALSVSQLLSLMWPTSAGSAVSKFVARSRGQGKPREADSVAAYLGKRTVQCSIPLAAVSVPLWISIDHGDARASLCLPLIILGYAGYNFTRGVQYGAGLVRRATIWEVVTAMLAITGVALLLPLGVRGLWLVLPFAGASLLYSAIGWPWRARGKPPKALRREIDHFVALGVIGTLASAGFMQLALLVAKVSQGEYSAGQYAAALTLAAPASMLASSLSMVLLPSMAEALGRFDKEAFRRQTDFALRSLILVMTGVVGVLAICSAPIVSFVWGAAFSQSPQVLLVLLLAVLANTVGVACTNSLTSGSTRGMVTSMLASLVGMAGGIGFWVLAVPRLGLIGVAGGYAFGALLISALPIAIVWRRDQHRWFGLLARTVLGLSVLGFLVGVSLVTKPSICGLLLDAGIFVGVWFLIMRQEAWGVFRILTRQVSLRRYSATKSSSA